MGHESYMHYYAKEIVQGWLVSAWKFNRKHSYDNKLYIFDWKIDCSDCNYGVRLEYPILSKRRPDGTKMILGVSTIWDEYPDLDKLADDIKVEMVLDIAIVEEGALKYGLEIVHKHICSQRKRDFILEYLTKVPIYELSAEWVLNQLVGPVPPKLWPCVRA